MAFRPKTRWVKYDPKTKLWIPTRKRIYLYWFKFLQHAERDPEYKVQWNKYDGWGGANVVLGKRFDDCWSDRWVDLFAVEKEGDTPKYPLSTKQPKSDGIRYALLVYENLHRGSNWEIGEYLAKKERSGRGFINSSFKETEDLKDYNDKSYVQSKVGRYKKAAHKYLTNVSNGQFP
jgi:hypothetical protein